MKITKSCSTHSQFSIDKKCSSLSLHEAQCQNCNSSGAKLSVLDDWNQQTLQGWWVPHQVSQHVMNPACMDRERTIRPNPTFDQQLETEVCRCTGHHGVFLFWEFTMTEEGERRIPKKQQAYRIFLHIHWSSDWTAAASIPQSDPAIDNCHSSPLLLLSWQQPSESPKTPQISPASPNLAMAPSKTTRPKNLPSQSQHNSWRNHSWWKTINCETEKIMARMSSKMYIIFYFIFGHVCFQTLDLAVHVWILVKP